MLNQVTFYTDGACSGNPGFGGWASVEVISCNDSIKTSVISGGKEWTTNNEMELTSVYMALVKSYKGKVKKVIIYSDSAYVVNAVTKGWLKNWSVNNWKTKEKKDIKNRIMWEKLFVLIYERSMDVTIIKVKGHSGDPLNDLADRAAVEAKQKIIERYKQ